MPNLSRINKMKSLIKSINEEKETVCPFYSLCPEIRKLEKSPDEDLFDHWYEVCTHPAEGVRERSCGIYRDFAKKSVQGNEEYLITFNGGIQG
jgi:hypothetical protein